MCVPASLIKSSIMDEAIPVSFAASLSPFISPGTCAAPPRLSLSCVAANSSHARKVIYSGIRESGKASSCATMYQSIYRSLYIGLTYR